MIHKLTLAEKIADYAIETDCTIGTAVEAITEQFVEDIMHSHRHTMEMNYEEIDILSEAIAGALDDISDIVSKIINEWNEDAREMADDRRRGLSGEY